MSPGSGVGIGNCGSGGLREARGNELVARLVTGRETQDRGIAMPQGAGPGRIVAGRYRLVETLGSGGFGTVWRAHDQESDADVALKEILLPAASGAERAKWLERAEREARHAVELQAHPNILAVHGVIIEDETPWILMELVVGCSLAQRLDDQRSLPPAQVATIAVGLLSALDAAHAAGIVHRDVKPSNVMLTDDGRVLLADFGIATRSTDTALTTTGTFLGSAEYTAPERAQGQDGNAASDLFSVGVTLYQSVEGVSPFRRDLPMGSLYATVNEAPPPMAQAGALEPLITRLLDKDSLRRPTAGQALAILRGTRTVEAIVVRTPTVRSDVQPEHQSAVRRASRLGIVWAGGLTAAALATVIALFAGSVFGDGSRADAKGAPPTSPDNTTSTATPATTPTTTPTEAPTTTTPTETQAPSSPTAVPLSSLPKPCSVLSASVRTRFSMGTPDPAADNSGVRQCSWHSVYKGHDYGIVLQYLATDSVDAWAGSASPVSIPGLSGAMEHIGTAANEDPGSCAIWWPTSFGSIGVIVVDSIAKDSQKACTTAESFVTAAAPDMPS
ncbi:serine/threonine-protein kinase [Streptomyces alboniger]|nr:serine/threonine-protein kinase [Streptomyces alboniger]